MAIRLGLAAGLFAAPEYINFTRLAAAPGGGIAEGVALLLSVLFTLNLLLFVFNLIPLPPLDGSGAVALLLSEERARRMRAWLHSPQLAFVGILVAWYLIGEIFPVDRAVLLEFDGEELKVAAARGGPTHDSVRLGVGIAPAGHVRDSEGGSRGVES